MQRFVLAPYSVAGYFVDRFVFGPGENQLLFENAQSWEEVLKFARFWLEPKELKQAFLSSQPLWTWDQFLDLFYCLKDSHFLIADSQDLALDLRFSRTAHYYQSIGLPPHRP